VTRVVHVVIPARDEERLLPRSLGSVVVAVERLRRGRPDLLVDCTVVLDRCTDGSQRVVREAGLRSLSVDHGVVGATRDAGVRSALASATAVGVDPGDVWIACTDADTLVPPHWLVRHEELSHDLDAVVGTVEPLGLTDAVVLAEWRARHELTEGHPHVHGANLGIRASTYLEVGGFRPLALDEDVDLVRRVRAHTTRWAATDSLRVRSSARRSGRVRGGFADYLADLEGEVG